jgi:glycosyltransferase involved in cell wall biosynthesis
MLDRANGILAVSRDTRSHFESWTDTQKICLAYDAVNPAPILERVAASQASGVRRLPFGPDHRVVGWVGRITPYKQPDLFIRAIPKLLSRFPEMRFVVVGSASERDRRYADSLHELASGLGLDERLGWMGNRPDAVEIMAELDCLCVTSTREPFPRVILEAQVCGCPLVASATGGCAEMVADGSTGILFDPMGPAAADNLAACLTSLFENPGYRERLSTQARQAVLNGLAGPEPVLRLEKILLDFGKRDERHG